MNFAIRDAVDRLQALWKHYTTLTKNMQWNHQADLKFIQNFYALHEDAERLVTYLESTNAKRSNAARDEFNMIMHLLECYNKQMRTKVKLVQKRLDASRLESLLKFDTVLMQLDPKYNARDLKYALPTPPRTPSPSGSQGGAKAKGKAKVNAKAKKNKNKKAPRKAIAA